PALTVHPAMIVAHQNIYAFGWACAIRVIADCMAARYRSCGCHIYMGQYCLYRSQDRKSTRLNSSHLVISYAVFCLKKKKKQYLIGTVVPTMTRSITPTKRLVIHTHLYHLIVVIYLHKPQHYINVRVVG